MSQQQNPDPQTNIGPSVTTTYTPNLNQELKHDLSQISSNWYSENTINLFLYIGAFFVIASASIFVGFQWESLQGITKALIISILTISFFIIGFFTYSKPKIKTAGRVFIAIGALLIPFCGLAWYNFVLKYYGFSFGSVWLGTSIIALTLYIFLSYYLKNTFYPYITSISILSLMLSLINTTNLANDYYILYGIISAFILSSVSIILKQQTKNQQTKEIFQYPLDLSSQIMLPLILINAQKRFSRKLK